MRSLWRTVDRDTIRVTVLICLSVAVVGVSYGVTAGSAGFSIWQLLALAVLVLGASSEFLFIGIIAAGGGALAAVAAGLLINSRNFAYGLAAGSFLGEARHRGSGWRKLVGAHLVNDESVAVAMAQGSVKQKRAAFWFCGIGIAVSWPIGALLGGLLGGVVQDPAALGLDAAFPVVILALVLPALREKVTLLAGVIGAAVAVATSPFLPSGTAPLVALLSLAVTIPFREKVR
ncbi:AzlC family ABC transporter permease [Rhodococcus erythropolis]|uniref:AzlC family ABC transporter permease n=1 Tax=Rhodococcus erythropolis TaxID=1833 RepID=UPI001E2C4735|nr:MULTISPECIES: AzlC family ABC transporter permease [Rhodococcus erythropolis group]MCD2104722.1 AzlC family ABC transporter permease [Rhodococcus qingshengii]MCZ4525152.1 AzlC family ABC transporter permease [Rhodococcus erythropolis]